VIPLSLAHLARVSGGRLTGITEADAEQLVIDGPVVTDSRECGPGGLYIARVGEQADGHDFIPQALEAGALAAMTTRVVDGVVCIVVDDIQDGFAALARGVVDAARDLTVIGITGSSGKTSTKDLLGQVLAADAPTIAPQGSYNSEVGVPLTVTRITPQTRYLVVEMGARGAGHITYLTDIAPPDISVVLNVGTAHLGEFGSREAIATAKSEIVSALDSSGLAVLNHDDPAVRAMAEVAPGRVVTVSASGDPAADLRAVEVELDAASRPSFTIVSEEAPFRVTLPLHGIHHVGNALAVVAVARECGIPDEVIASALRSSRSLSRWRMEVTERPNGVIIVNDAYNANPDSMRAALDALAVMAEGRRGIAVLGTMLELGENSDAEHAEVGRYALAGGVDLLVCVGAGGPAIAAGAEGHADRCHVVADADAAYDLLKGEIRPGDVVLFKSSRDAGLRHLGDRLAEDASTAADPDQEGSATCSPS